MASELTTTQKFLNRIEGLALPIGFERKKNAFVRDREENLLVESLAFIGSDPRSKTLITHPVLVLAFRSDRHPTPESGFGLWLADFGARFGFEGAHQISHYNDSSANFRWFELFGDVLAHVVMHLDPILADADQLAEFLSTDPHFSRKTDLIARVAELPERPQGS